MSEKNFTWRRWRILLPGLLLLLLAAGCADKAREPKPGALSAAADVTAANATATAAEAENATAAVPDAALESADATAADCAPAPPEEAPAKTGKAAAKPAKAGTPAAASALRSQERARQEFTSFAQHWLATLSRNMVGNAEHKVVAREGAEYVARFAEVDQDSLELEVNPTGSSSCPFVGVLKYFECSYEARGNSAAAAKSGSFSLVRKVRYTELFSYTGKRWQ